MKKMIMLFGLFILCLPLMGQEKTDEPAAESVSVIPSKMSYQGVLADNNGEPVPDSTRSQAGSSSIQYKLVQSDRYGDFAQKAQEFLSLFNKMGSDGWEYVTEVTFRLSTLSGKTKTYYLFVKK